MVGGPHRVTSAPSLVRPQMLERATRLWAMSPMMVTFLPAQVAQPLAHGHDVQQALGGMLVGAVAGVDHRAVQHLGQVARRPGANCAG